MIGNAYIFVIYAPEEPETPTGSTIECNNNEGTSYTTEEVTGAISYIWNITPSNAGTITGETLIASVDWNEEFSGTANVSVAAVNACFTGPASDNLGVTVNEAPQPAISGDQDVCDWEPGLVYSTPAVEGNTYTWEVYNGHITAGDGTNEVTVTWHDPGTGWAKVTEANDNCTVTTANFDIFIDDCVGIGEDGIISFSLYPNPAKDELQVRFGGQASDYRIVILNQLGQVVYDKMTGGEQKMIINTSEFASGIYALRVYGENELTEKKFIKID
jgi:hypothetical protein